jgi:hypothetical protein
LPVTTAEFFRYTGCLIGMAAIDFGAMNNCFQSNQHSSGVFTYPDFMSKSGLSWPRYFPLLPYC